MLQRWLGGSLCRIVEPLLIKKETAMTIWFSAPDITAMNKAMENTACSNLGIEVTEVGDDWVKGTMPADPRTFQPIGLVHGGANVLFAETLGSMAANLCLDNSKEYAVGQEINANHLRGVRSGTLTEWQRSFIVAVRHKSGKYGFTTTKKSSAVFHV